MFVAEVVGTLADEKYMDEKGKFIYSDTKPICYSHGEYYGLGKKLGKFGYSVEKKKTKAKRAKRKINNLTKFLGCVIITYIKCYILVTL